MRLPLRMVAALLAVIAGCAPRPGVEALQLVPETRELDTVTIHVATNRSALPPETPGAPSPGFGTARTLGLAGVRYTLSIPPTHRTGEIEWPGDPPDSATSMTVVERRDMRLPDLVNDIATGPWRHHVRVFVHGYNTNFPEGLFRLAQITRDSGDPGASLLFSWPSVGTLAGYAADQEAATYSRDYLAGLLKSLARDRRIGQITVLGHSMGGWLVMESLRQLRLAGDDATIARLEVILAAPDIDIDVFRTQLDVLGPLDPPLTVLVSTDDRALQISRRVNASRARVGALDISDPRIVSAAAAANVALIDIGSIRAPQVSRHSRYAMLAALYPEISEHGGRMLADAGAFVLERAGAAVASPFVLIARGLAPN